MFRQKLAVGLTALTLVLSSATLLGQHTPEQQTPEQQTPGQLRPVPPNCTGECEFPAIMRQNVAAGKTPVGTKVEAKLVLATLVSGAVVPKDAILSGEVIESVARSGSEPSRLAIRMDSAQWKNGSASLKVYLTAWFYPEVAGMAAQDLSYQPPDAANSKRNWNGMGTYPDPNNPVAQQRFPRDTDKDTTSAPPQASNTSKRRVLLKNVETARNSDGGVALTSTRSNIKLDKLTTYVFAASDLQATK
jgi:hypothetical protein